MDLEAQRTITRSRLARNPFRRAVGLTGDLIVNAGRHAVPIISSALARRGSGSVASGLATPPRTPATKQVMRGRSMSRGRSVRSMSISRSRSRSRRRVSSSGITTFQHDVGFRYANRRRRRRGVGRFRRRVLNVELQNQPLQIYTKQGAATGSSPVSQRGNYGVGIYTTKQTDQPDLSSIFADAGYNLATQPACSGRIWIKSVCLDVQIKNTDDNDVILDIYEILNVKDVGSTLDINAQLNDYYQKMTTLTSASYVDAAVSLFENPVFCQHYKILRKREVIVTPGQIITMQMRSGKDRQISAQSVIDNPGAIPKLGRFYLFSWTGSPNPTAGPSSTPALEASTLTFTWQKSYKYALVPSPRQNAQVHNA